MRFSPAYTATAAALIGSTLALPVEKRADTLSPVLSTADENVLQLALYLEHLELNLYTQGYNNYSDAQYTAEGFPQGFRDNVGVIAAVSSPTTCTILSVLPLTIQSNSTNKFTPTPYPPSSPQPAKPQSHPAPTDSPPPHQPSSSSSQTPLPPPASAPILAAAPS